MKTLTLVTILTLLLVACGGEDGASPATGCAGDDFGATLAQMEDGALGEFIDAEAVAQSTARIALSGVVRDLQRAQDDLAVEDWPGCAAPIKAAFDDWMTQQIEVYLAFMADKGKYVVQQQQHEAGKAWDAAVALMEGE